jgi:hypothetical protein
MSSWLFLLKSIFKIISAITDIKQFNRILSTKLFEVIVNVISNSMSIYVKSDPIPNAKKIYPGVRISSPKRMSPTRSQPSPVIK